MKTEIITFFVPSGKIATAGSKTIVTTKTGQQFLRPASKFTKEWMNTVRHFARLSYQGELLDGAVELTIRFVLPRPKNHFGTGKNAGKLKDSAPFYPLTHPDLSKAIRAVEDALTGIIWKDDKQVVRFGSGTCKDYGQPYGAYVTIISLDNKYAVLKKALEQNQNEALQEKIHKPEDA